MLAPESPTRYVPRIAPRIGVGRIPRPDPTRPVPLTADSAFGSVEALSFKIKFCTRLGD